MHTWIYEGFRGTRANQPKKSFEEEKQMFLKPTENSIRSFDGRSRWIENIWIWTYLSSLFSSCEVEGLESRDSEDWALFKAEKQESVYVILKHVKLIQNVHMSIIRTAGNKPPFSKLTGMGLSRRNIYNFKLFYTSTYIKSPRGTWMVWWRLEEAIGLSISLWTSVLCCHLLICMRNEWRDV